MTPRNISLTADVKVGERFGRFRFYQSWWCPTVQLGKTWSSLQNWQTRRLLRQWKKNGSIFSKKNRWFSQCLFLRIFFYFWWFFSPRKLIWIAGILPQKLFLGVFSFVNFVAIAKANNCRFVTENQEHCIYSQMFYGGPKSWSDVGITEMLDNIFFTTSGRGQAIHLIGVLKNTNSGDISGRHTYWEWKHPKEGTILQLKSQCQNVGPRPVRD